MSEACQADRKVLLEAARAGDAEPLGHLLRLYWHHLRILAETQLDQRLRARVSPSDIVQDTLFEAHRDFGQFRGRSEPEFLGWIRSILANNLARAFSRHVVAEKRGVNREVSLDAIGASLERSAARLEEILHDDQPTPSSHVDRQERLLAVSAAMAELPDDYRHVLVWRHLEGNSFQVIGERMQRSAGACRMLWLRAIDQLRQRLEAGGW